MQPSIPTPQLTTLILLACCGGAALHAEGPRPMRFLDVLEFRDVSQGSLSNDGKMFVYSQSELDWKAGKRYTDLMLSQVGGTTGRRLTFTESNNESDPAFSPDGKYLAFLSDRSENLQLYMMSLQGGEARKLTAIEGGVTSFAFSRDGRWIAIVGGRSSLRRLYLWDMQEMSLSEPVKHPTDVAAMAWSPDSRSIYFLAPDSQQPLERRRLELKFDVRIVDWPESPRHLWKFDLTTRQTARLTSGANLTIRAFRVSPDGNFITFSGGVPDRYADSRNWEGWLLPLATGRPERLTTNQVPETLPKVSPDGRWVCFTSAQDFTPFRRDRLYLRPTSGGPWKMLPQQWDGDVRQPEFSADSSRIYYWDGVGVGREVFELPLNESEPRQLTRLNAYVSPRYYPESDRFVLEYEDPSTPGDYFLAAAQQLADRSSWQRLSDANPQAGQFALGAYETVQWKSTDGRTVEGILVKPLHYDARQPYPLIVQIHGGPAGAFERRFASSYGTYVHVFAAGGYAVFQPNYRGSSNYGERFRMEIAGDYFRQAFDDIMTGVDELIRRGIADPQRLGMMGWSAGGHWSNWALTHTKRFRAISSGAGAVNWISLYAQTDIQSNREFYFKGKPWENWEHYVEVSPLRYIRNASTPTLIHVGESDPRVPKPQSDELHMALKKLGVPVEYIVYPRMGHGITNPRYQMVKMVSEYNWFEKWIRGKDNWFDWKEILDTVPSRNQPAQRSEQ